MWPRFGRFSGLPRMVGGCRLCQMLCFSMGHMLICVVRVFVVVRKSRFFPSPPLATCRGLVAALGPVLGEEQQASSRRAREKSARRRPWRVARRPRALRSRRCAPLGGALRSCPKLGGALLLHEELAPAASATCERSASMAIRPRSWSREHRSGCGEGEFPSRPRARLSASSATSRSTALGACALKRRVQLWAPLGWPASFSRFFLRGRLPLQVTVN